MFGWRILVVHPTVATSRDGDAMTNDERDARDRMDDAQLPDGRYDAFVVWADARDDGHIAFELTLTTGDHKGEMVTVLARSSADPLSRVGLPCTLVVEHGSPRLELE